VVSTVSISLPAGARNIGPTSVTVTVSFVPISGSLRITVAPQVVAVADGLDAVLDVGSVAVVVEGPLALLNSLLPSRVLATVNAAGLDAGTTELAVKVSVPLDLSVVAVQPPTLSVTLESSR
jgi:YbbR domain-containing protein